MNIVVTGYDPKTGLPVPRDDEAQHQYFARAVDNPVMRQKFPGLRARSNHALRRWREHESVKMQKAAATTAVQHSRTPVQNSKDIPATPGELTASIDQPVRNAASSTGDYVPTVDASNQTTVRGGGRRPAPSSSDRTPTGEDSGRAWQGKVGAGQVGSMRLQPRLKAPGEPEMDYYGPMHGESPPEGQERQHGYTQVARTPTGAVRFDRDGYTNDDYFDNSNVAPPEPYPQPKPKPQARGAASRFDVGEDQPVRNDRYGSIDPYGNAHITDTRPQDDPHEQQHAAMTGTPAPTTPKTRTVPLRTPEMTPEQRINVSKSVTDNANRRRGLTQSDRNSHGDLPVQKPAPVRVASGMIAQQNPPKPPPKIQNERDEFDDFSPGAEHFDLEQEQPRPRPRPRDDDILERDARAEPTIGHYKVRSYDELPENKEASARMRARDSGKFYVEPAEGNEFGERMRIAPRNAERVRNAASTEFYAGNKPGGKMLPADLHKLRQGLKGAMSNAVDQEEAAAPKKAPTPAPAPANPTAVKPQTDVDWAAATAAGPKPRKDSGGLVRAIGRGFDRATEAVGQTLGAPGSETGRHNMGENFAKHLGFARGDTQPVRNAADEVLPRRVMGSYADNRDAGDGLGTFVPHDDTSAGFTVGQQQGKRFGGAEQRTTQKLDQYLGHLGKEQQALPIPKKPTKSVPAKPPTKPVQNAARNQYKVAEYEPGAITKKPTLKPLKIREPKPAKQPKPAGEQHGPPTPTAQQTANSAANFHPASAEGGPPAPALPSNPARRAPTEGADRRADQVARDQWAKENNRPTLAATVAQGLATTPASKAGFDKAMTNIPAKTTQKTPSAGASQRHDALKSYVSDPANQEHVSNTVNALREGNQSTVGPKTFSDMVLGGNLKESRNQSRLGRAMCERAAQYARSGMTPQQALAASGLTTTARSR